MNHNNLVVLKFRSPNVHDLMFKNIVLIFKFLSYRACPPLDLIPRRYYVVTYLILLVVSASISELGSLSSSNRIRSNVRPRDLEISQDHTNRNRDRRIPVGTEREGYWRYFLHRLYPKSLDVFAGNCVIVIVVIFEFVNSLFPEANVTIFRTPASVLHPRVDLAFAHRQHLRPPLPTHAPFPRATPLNQTGPPRPSGQLLLPALRCGRYRDGGGGVPYKPRQRDYF